MNRDYATGTEQDVIFFVGAEVEHTPAFGMQTLFITGCQTAQEIVQFAEQERCTHLFFGANHSFRPETPSDWEKWDELIILFLDQGYLCSLDIPVTLAEEFLNSPLVEYDNFIPQLRIPLPYISQWNYNTMIKIDDIDFNSTNPGVWCHRLHSLLDEKKFTSWNKYHLDKVLK